MRPIIYSELSGFLITEGLNNRHEECVPEPGPQPEDKESSFENLAVQNTFGQRVKNFLHLGVPARSARVHKGYQRNF